MITRFYSYTLTLHAPLLLPKLGGDPNSVRHWISSQVRLYEVQ